MREEDRENFKSASVTERIDGELHTVKTFFDEAGNVIERSVTPLMLEFQFKDVCQILVGAAVLSIPTAYTEEIWVLGEKLPLPNMIGVIIASLTFVGMFGYFIFYKDHFRGYQWELTKRVVFVYLITFVVSAMILCLLQKLPMMSDPLTALNRTVLVAFPGCFSGTVVDSLK